MNCNEVQRKLTDELDSRFEHDVVDHLTTCSSCRGLVDDLLEMQDLIQIITTSSKIPRHLYADVLDGVAQNHRRPWFLNRAVFASVALLLFVVGFFWAGGFVFSENPPTQQTELLIEQEIHSPDLNDLNESDYIDLVVEESPEGELIIRLPSVIEVRKTELHEDVYINHVSH